jgi:hypothetical protein
MCICVVAFCSATGKQGKPPFSFEINNNNNNNNSIQFFIINVPSLQQNANYNYNNNNNNNKLTNSLELSTTREIPSCLDTR